jgi:hypothetical protein
MTTIKILLLTAMTATLFWLLVRLLKEKHWGKTFFTSMMVGVLSLIGVYIIGQFKSDILQINLYTLTTASVLGVPGVILMVLVSILWQL